MLLQPESKRLAADAPWCVACLIAMYGHEFVSLQACVYVYAIHDDEHLVSDSFLVLVRCFFLYK
jgi:hypothetical protein